MPSRVRSIAVFLAVAAALACATMLTASFLSSTLPGWLQSLPPASAKLVQPLLTLCIVLFVLLGVILRRRRGEPEDEI